MSRANICDNEEYTSAAGILEKCSVACINLISGGDKDSPRNSNCKKFCGGCYAYYSTKADTETTAPPAFTSPSTAVTNPTTAVDTTTALFPPCDKTTLTVMISVLIPIIIIMAIAFIVIFGLIVASRKYNERVQNFWKTLLGIKQPHPQMVIHKYL
ncbi:uncharacterized protein LOC135491447 [Lineus longissimus]|uniref:uncharacterized protein LOC135491447 n=1 Tax=Lineus longissimus TaxID=88925 RepID=UPI00315DC52A